jgi:hypothetical protein
MKKLKTFLTFMMFIPLAIAAQQKFGGHQKDTIKNSNAAEHPHFLKFSQLDQRKIYHWGNGQRSTATGREAGETLPDRVQLIGSDSAVVIFRTVKK